MRQAARSMCATIGPGHERTMIGACCLSADKQSPGAEDDRRRGLGAAGSPGTLEA
jgi:hypothetical protein